MSSFQFETASVEERNAKCAEFMPASDINPICGYYLTWRGKMWQRLAVKSIDEAQSWLNIAKLNKHNWNQLLPEHPWHLRSEIGVSEFHHRVRYSDTPAGAWMLIEELDRRGFSVLLRRRDGKTELDAVCKVTNVSISAKGDDFPKLTAKLFLEIMAFA